MTIGLILALLLWTTPAPQSGELEGILGSITGGEIFELNKTLSSAAMEGRLSGTEGYNRAANWAAEKFRAWNLAPVYGGSYLQPFEVGYNEMLDTQLTLSWGPEAGQTVQSEPIEMEIYKDFCPTLYSGFGEVEAEVVFAGFGISAPELGWDDYRDLDVRGKIVATLRGAPVIQGKDFSKYEPRQVKLENAKDRGAAGQMLIFRPVVSGAGEYVEGLPVIMVGESVVQALFEPRGFEFSTVEAILRDGHPLSFPTGVRARLRVAGNHVDKALTYNVVAMVEGSDPLLKEECIIFGGHLDHLGPWPVLHPGASDNASGSAVVMGLAQAFSKLTRRPKRSLVFALFAAEELGLLGSRYMAANLPDHPSKPVMMVNHDMNGVGHSLHVAGGTTYPGLYELLQKVNREFAINPNMSAGEISVEGGNSDYTPFLEKGIPAYANWVRGGQSYGVHTAEDSIYIITPKIMEDIVKLYFMAGFRFADR